MKYEKEIREIRSLRSENKILISCQMPKSITDRLDYLAERDCSSRSELSKIAILQLLKSEGV